MKKITPKVRKKRGLLVGVRTGGDGHTRVSRGEDFVAVGGTKDGHEHLRETVAEIKREVDRRGRRLAEVRREEFREIVSRAIERTGPAPK